MSKKRNYNDYVCIGLGGIGSHLIYPLSQYLDWHQPGARVFLVDGKNYEPRKEERQRFDSLGNKAEVQFRELSRKFTKIHFRPIPIYVTKENARRIIPDNAVIFVMPDNHQTRKIVSNYVEKLKNVVAIYGGNFGADDDSQGKEGSVLIHIREKGRDVTGPITRFHPEIAHPDDKHPQEMSCEEMARSQPQILFTNLTVATWMLNAFLAIRENCLTYGEICFNINGKVVIYQRPP